MGTLIAKRYPITLLANAADHTYVECGTGGAAWSCWGGKTGGTELRRGAGSTKRADCIAEPDERAGVTCYLINGVCHQAANRILMPARITVRGARAYWLSSALYGTYGRLGFWPCRAPFYQHVDVTGDLPACAEAADADAAPADDEGNTDSEDESEESAAESQYLDEVVGMYAQASREASADSASPAQAGEFNNELFLHMASFRMRARLDAKVRSHLKQIHMRTESTRFGLESSLAEDKVGGREFVALLNEETVAFQNELASTLDDAAYKALLGLKRGETFVLADPEIVARLYPE